MRTLFLVLALTLAGCAEHWQTVASRARENQLACGRAKAEGSSWGVFSSCAKAADVPLPPDCLASDAAARSDHCVAIAKGEALGGAVTSAGTAGVVTGAAMVH